MPIELSINKGYFFLFIAFIWCKLVLYDPIFSPSSLSLSLSSSLIEISF